MLSKHQKDWFIFLFLLFTFNKLDYFSWADVGIVGDKNGLDDLIKTFKTGNADSQLVALHEIAFRGDKAQSVVPLLLETLNSNYLNNNIEFDENEKLDLRLTIIQVLQTIGCSDKDINDVLRSLLRQFEIKSKKVWVSTIRTLGSFRSRSIPIMPVLKQLFLANPRLANYSFSNDATITQQIADALQMINPEEAVSVFKTALVKSSYSNEVKTSSIKTLGKMGILGKSAIPILYMILVNSNEDLSSMCSAHHIGNVSDALVRMGEEGLSAVNKAFESGSPELQEVIIDSYYRAYILDYSRNEIDKITVPFFKNFAEKSKLDHQVCTKIKSLIQSFEMWSNTQMDTK